MRNVLIVEDDPMVMKINKRYTELVKGFKVIGCVTSEEEVIDYLDHGTVDLIIMDVYLPGKSGLEILKSIRKKLYTVDVIMVTAANTVEEVKKAFACGVVDYLVKPFEFERYKQALTQYLEKDDILRGKDTLKQNDIDTICCKTKESKIIPKGLQKQTLNKVLTLMKSQREKVWTIKEISSDLGISNVTIKKYMDYLEDSNKIIATQNYGNIGRPEYNYVLSSKGE